MGRLPAGQKPTPPKVRLQKYLRDLEESGGLRLMADIEAPAHEALQIIMELDTPASEVRGVTKKEAVSNALMHYAKSLQRRSR
jgi:hypothetical protein